MKMLLILLGIAILGVLAIGSILVDRPEPDGNGYRPVRVAANTSSISPSEAANRLAKLPDRPSFDYDLPAYHREEWGGWRDINGDCRDTRADVLAAESLERVTYPNGCTVVKGKWQDPWNGRTFEDAGDLDVDHHVPLADAHYSGGYAWSEEQKRTYYNDTQLPVALNAMSRLDNRAKGADAPHRWNPALPEKHCTYATGWIAVKSKYDLSVTPGERQALAQMLQSCPK